jgi:hypothetical protein
MAPSSASQPSSVILVPLSRPPEPPNELTGVQFVNLEESILSANKCSCSASDDNPY